MDFLDGGEIGAARFIAEAANGRLIYANQRRKLGRGDAMNGKVFGKLHGHKMPYWHLSCKHKNAL